MLVSDLMQRVTNKYLHPAGYNRPAFDTLSGTLDASTLSMTTNGLEEYLGQSVVEFDDATMELVLTKEPESSTSVDIQERGYMDTTAGTHANGCRLWIDPPFPRQTIFNSVVALVGWLNTQGLYSATVDTTHTFTETVIDDLPTTAVDVLSITARVSSTSGRRVELERGRDYDVWYDASPIEIQLYCGANRGDTLRITYSKDMVVPTAISQDLTTTCLVPATLVPFMDMWVAGDLLQGQELSHIQRDTISRVIEEEGIPPGTHINLAQGLQQIFERKYVTAERTRLRRTNPIRWRYR